MFVNKDTNLDVTTNLWTKDFIFISIINLAAFVGFNMLSTAMPLYVASLGASDFLVGMVTTLTTLAILSVRPISGIMLDRFGRRGILIYGTAITVVIISSYAFFPILSIILLIRIFQGIAWGLTSTSVSTIVADIIPRKRFAEGMGYFALTTAFAVAFAPAIALNVLENRGFPTMVTIAAISTFIALVLSFFQRTVKIEKVGLQKIKPSDLFEKRAMLPAIMALLVNSAFGAVTTFIAIHGAAEGVDNIYIYFTVYACATLVTRPITGKLIDKKGFFMPGIISISCVAITLILIGFSHNIIMFSIAGIFAGIGFGTNFGVNQTMAVASVPPNRRGVATSTFFFGFDAGIGLGAAVAGLLAGACGYANMYFAMSVFPIAAMLIFIILGKKRIEEYSAK
ncbi:MAG: MFS transporter [Eubacteriales bacterium]|nr:MFS transporter [Eubacteriales bacterium]MDD4389993.1 MFS transporter [Eubacteriales bacterium]